MKTIAQRHMIARFIMLAAMAVVFSLPVAMAFAGDFLTFDPMPAGAVGAATTVAQTSRSALLSEKADSAEAAAAEAGDAASIGSGDGRIHVIPSLHPRSLKDGDTLTVSAVVTSALPVKSVTANLGGMATVELKPDARAGGAGLLPGGGHAAVYAGEWTGAGLEEKVYAVTLTVTDALGRSHTDRSLQFSDPAAGLSTPGTTMYPNGGMERLSVEVLPDEFRAGAGVIDAIDGYAYFGTIPNSGYGKLSITKFSLGVNNSLPKRIGAISIHEYGGSPQCAIIDEIHGYAYFGLDTIPGKILKVALGNSDELPRVASELILDDGEDNLVSAVINTSKGVAYFGVNTSPGKVIKIDLGDGDTQPIRIGATNFVIGENGANYGLIDTVNQYVYFVASSKIVKLSLGNGVDLPTRIGSIPLQSDEKVFKSAVIDADNGYAYYGISSPNPWNSGKIVKVSLGLENNLPERIGALLLESGETNLGKAFIDTNNGFAYFYLNFASSPRQLLMIALGSGNSLPTRIGSIKIDESAPDVNEALIDNGNMHAYLFALGYQSSIFKIALESGPSLPTILGSTPTVTHEGDLVSGGIDLTNLYAYWGARSGLKLIKTRLGDGNEPTMRIGSANIPDFADNWSHYFFYNTLIDLKNGHAYIGTESKLSRIVKFDLGEGDNPPHRIGETILNDSDEYLRAAMIDPGNGFAYFATSTSPTVIVKVLLGSGNDLPSRVSSVTLGNGEYTPLTAVIDPVRGYSYWGVQETPLTGKIVKVALGDGNSSPTRIGAISFNENYSQLFSSGIDVERGLVYFASGSKLIKFEVGEGDNLPVLLGSESFDGNEWYPETAIFDFDSGHGYFGANHGKVVKFDLGDGHAPPTRLGAITLKSEEIDILSAVIDVVNGHGYFGTYTEPGQIVKVRLGNMGSLKGMHFMIPEMCSINDIRFYSHESTGTVRLALYDNFEPKNLLWESGPTTNTAENAELIVPISAGTPPSLVLSPGMYWAAWQVDTNTDVPSYTPGVMGDGFTFRQAFGPAPELLAAEEITMTADRWTQYITYTPLPPEIDMWYLK